MRREGRQRSSGSPGGEELSESELPRSETVHPRVVGSWGSAALRPPQRERANELGKFSQSRNGRHRSAVNGALPLSGCSRSEDAPRLILTLELSLISSRTP